MPQAALVSAMEVMPLVMQELPTGATIAAVSGDRSQGDMQQASMTTNGSLATRSLGALQSTTAARMPAGNTESSTAAGVLDGEMPSASVLADPNGACNCNDNPNGVSGYPLHAD